VDFDNLSATEVTEVSDLVSNDSFVEPVDGVEEVSQDPNLFFGDDEWDL
jgi:hypothetical protein